MWRALSVVVATGLPAAALAVLGLVGVSTPAAAVSKKVENACKADYKRLCPAYRPNSAQLRACMSSKSNEISWTCISALIDSGEIDRRRVRR